MHRYRGNLRYGRKRRVKIDLVFHVGLRDRKEWVELLSRMCTDTIAPSPQILTLARRLMNLRKIKPRDALHMACAQHGGCDFFITCDDALIQRASRGVRQSVLQVKVVNPVEFIQHEGRRYGKG
jgi:predicted nucleic acid-binding protein